MKTNRLKNSVFNGLSNVIVNLSSTLLAFIVRTIFIKTLGKELLGLDGLFTNILSLLSLAELGFSTAISFSLYEPLAKKNYQKVNQIVIYLKKIYRFIALTILLMGLTLVPFLPFIVKNYTVDSSIYIIYLLYLANTSFSYLLSYSSVLIEADQKNYQLTHLRLGFDFFTYALQGIALLIYKNFILYLVIQFIIRFIQRIVTNNFIKKRYSNLDFKNNLPMDEKDKKEIKTNIKGIIFHRVGDYAVNSTDNILISSIIGIATTGIYSNYLAITSIFKNLMSTILSATTSSLGNLNVTENEKTTHNVFNLLNFLSLFLTGILVVGIYCCINDFITIWAGESYVLNTICTIMICINLYLACILFPVDAIKNSTGLYYIDRYVPILQAIINLVVSILLGKKIGLLGILLGTTISSILTVSITKPYIIYKYVFKDTCLPYYKKVLENVLLVAATILLGKFIFSFIFINNLWIYLVIKGIIIVFIYCILFLASNFYKKEFKYFKNMIVRK